MYRKASWGHKIQTWETAESENLINYGNLREEIGAMKRILSTWNTLSEAKLWPLVKHIIQILKIRISQIHVICYADRLCDVKGKS